MAVCLSFAFGKKRKKKKNSHPYAQTTYIYLDTYDPHLYVTIRTTRYGGYYFRIRNQAKTVFRLFGTRARLCSDLCVLFCLTLPTTLTHTTNQLIILQAKRFVPFFLCG